MKRILSILADYLKNALASAAIGVALSIIITIAQGETSVSLELIGACALIGLVCGTCSKAAIECAVSLFSTRRPLAYLLNALIIAVVIVVLVQVLFHGFGGLDTWVIALIFAIPELTSVLLVGFELNEAARFKRAFDKRRSPPDPEKTSYRSPGA